MKYKIILLIILCYACNNKENCRYFILPESNAKTLKIHELSLDTFLLSPLESSYLGEICLKNDTILFVDKKFCWIFAFDSNGKFLRRYLGRGGGPMELNTGTIDGFGFLPNNSYIFIGGGNDFHIHNHHFEREKSFVVKYLSEIGKRFHIYTKTYEKLIVKTYDNFLYYNVVCEYPKFNFIKTPSSFFEEAYVIAKLDLSTGYIVDMLGGYSPAYWEYETKRQFSFTNFDIDKDGNFYVNFEADSLIYVYDQNYQIKKSFGFQGKDMNLEYASLSTINDFRYNYRNEREKCGFYDWLTYDDASGLLFRSYRKGNWQPTDGLQIYDGTTLIGDVSVPKQFKVLGYIEPYFYAKATIDEDNERIVLYKFKLDLP
jgi:hypothetical protein